MSTKTIGAVLLVLAIAAVGTAIVTLIPATALHGNDLGYFSLCPFAPWSTLMLVLLAGVIWVVRGYVLTRTG
jgi:hypothetical protein